MSISITRSSDWQSDIKCEYGIKCNNNIFASLRGRYIIPCVSCLNKKICCDDCYPYVKPVHKAWSPIPDYVSQKGCYICTRNNKIDICLQ